jgi:hypothetical protein
MNLLVARSTNFRGRRIFVVDECSVNEYSTNEVGRQTFGRRVYVSTKSRSMEVTGYRLCEFPLSFPQNDSIMEQAMLISETDLPNRLL